MNAIQDALDAIGLLNHSIANRRKRVDDDKRIKYLRGIVLANTNPVLGHGVYGLIEVFDQLTSSENARKIRAKYLLSARHSQLSKLRAAAKANLEYAAKIRKDEVHYRYCEQIEAGFKDLDHMLDAMSKPLS